MASGASCDCAPPTLSLSSSWSPFIPAATASHQAFVVLHGAHHSPLLVGVCSASAQPLHSTERSSRSQCDSAPCPHHTPQGFSVALRIKSTFLGQACKVLCDLALAFLSSLLIHVSLFGTTTPPIRYHHTPPS